MEWQQIVGFHQVAKLKSFTRAAEATYRTQSALTQQIKKLEREYGCQLLERIGKRKILLTPPGERFYQFCESLLLEYNQLREDIAEHQEQRIGRLRIAAPFTTLYHLLPGIISKYNHRYPWVELSLYDRPQKAVVELVRNGDVDFGVAIESSPSSELNKQRWKKVDPVLLIPLGHPLADEKKMTISAISQYPLILPPKSGDQLHRSRLEELFSARKLRYSVVMESSNIELSSRYVEMGLGVSFASIVHGLPILKKRKLKYISLSHMLPSEYLCVFFRRNMKLSSYQESFLCRLG
jgi:DNA-binding transcriptional LysR family regulator